MLFLIGGLLPDVALPACAMLTNVPDQVTAKNESAVSRFRLNADRPSAGIAADLGPEYNENLTAYMSAETYQTNIPMHTRTHTCTHTKSHTHAQHKHEHTNTQLPTHSCMHTHKKSYTQHIHTHTCNLVIITNDGSIPICGRCAIRMQNATHSRCSRRYARQRNVDWNHFAIGESSSKALSGTRCCSGKQTRRCYNACVR